MKRKHLGRIVHHSKVEVYIVSCHKEEMSGAIIPLGLSGQPEERGDEAKRGASDIVMERTWTSPPRSGPSLQPQSHSVHHFTGFASSSSSSSAVRDILESGRGNGSGGRLACGVAVRGGGERGLGRSSGAGALTTFAENRFPE